MATFIFKNGKSKRIHTRNVEDDVVLTLPNEPGIVFTTNTTDDAISGKNQDPNYIDSVHAKYILKPDIGNNGGVRNENANITPLRRAAYITSSNFIGPLEYTEWEAYTDEFLTNLLDTTTLVLHKDSWYPNTTALGLDVYIRYRFYSGEIRSPWSDTIHFKTPMLGIEPFTVTVTESLTPTIRTSGFIVDGETSLGKVNHYATTYKIFRIDTGELVYSSEDNTEDLLEHTVTKRLDRNTSYYLEVFYTADNELVGDSNTVTLSFRTPDVKIETPVVSYDNTSPVEGYYDREYDVWYGITGHFILSSPFRSEDSNLRHMSTLWKIYATSDEGDRLVFSVETFKNLTYLNITNYLTEPETNLRAEVIYKSEGINSNPGILSFTKEDILKPVEITSVIVNDETWDYINAPDNPDSPTGP